MALSHTIGRGLSIAVSQDEQLESGATSADILSPGEPAEHDKESVPLTAEEPALSQQQQQQQDK